MRRASIYMKFSASKAGCGPTPLALFYAPSRQIGRLEAGFDSLGLQLVTTRKGPGGIPFVIISAPVCYQWHISGVFRVYF